MVNERNLWVIPSDIDEDLDLATIDPSDENTLAHYDIAMASCEFASSILWSLSGRKYHALIVNNEQYANEYNPVRPAYVPSVDYYPSPGHPKASQNPTRVRLRGTPVRKILEVIDIRTGRALNSSEYQLLSQSFLELKSETPMGVEVSYTYGTPPPAAGRMAAQYLALQFYMLWSGQEDKCKLPDRVSAVTRQGVSWAVLDNQDFLDELKTGVYQVDLFLRAVNPDRARTKAKVFSVDMPRGRRRR